MTGQVCYSGTAENDPDDVSTAERTMSENCLLPLPSTASTFFEMLDYEFRRAIRYRNAVTLMFIKLCRLDEIVGNHGQKAAERVMSEIERIIRSNIRNTDRHFVYGKDEFMIILPNTQKTGASNLIPKLQRLIEAYRYTNGSESSLKLTPKFGLASYPEQEFKTDFQENTEECAKTKVNHNVIKLVRYNTAS
jgi:diguanylate cyclase (GGDEF)-like protein